VRLNAPNMCAESLLRRVSHPDRVFKEGSEDWDSRSSQRLITIIDERLRRIFYGLLLVWSESLKVSGDVFCCP